jgi:selenocysteine lyase/cysteine desulfurase
MQRVPNWRFGTVSGGSYNPTRDMEPTFTPSALPDRSDFDIPPGTAYLNAAAYGPLSRAVAEAGRRALAIRATPWRLDPLAATADIEQARSTAANIINARPEDLAIVSSVSHAVAIAAATLPPQSGARVLRLAGEHPSNVLSWAGLIARGCVEQIVPEPADGDWTAAVLEAIEPRGARPLAVATFGSCHWRDGAKLDIDVVAPAVRGAGGALFIDATHMVGAEPVDVTRHRPDFVAFPLFKWLLGPYGMAFLYASAAQHGGVPTDLSATNCKLTADFAWAAPAEGARRYDRGERDDPVAAAMAAAALAQLKSWGVAQVAARLRLLGDELAAAAVAAGLSVRSSALRAPHILGLRFDSTFPATDIVRRLAADGVIVSERSGVVRVAPHVYNDKEDILQFADALGRALRG